MALQQGPIRLQPEFRSRPWAGSMLREYLSEHESPSLPADIGEAWLAADTPDVQTSVAAGPWGGRTLGELVEEYPKEIVGSRHRPGERFPVCARLLDVGEDQPLMVHPPHPIQTPDTEYLPNNKFWHSVAGTEYSRMQVGLGMRVTRLQFMERLGHPGLYDLLRSFPYREGDSYFIPSGRLHRLTGGNLLWELSQSQTSPVTVQDEEGRQNLDLAQHSLLQCIHFQDRQLGRISRETGQRRCTRRIPLVSLCPDFFIEEIRLEDHLFDRTSRSSFHLLSVIRGRALLQHEGTRMTLRPGEACLIPACAGAYRLAAEGGNADLLRTTLKEKL